MILSLQGCMAVGKTTAINYLKEHAEYVHISYEENSSVVAEIKSRGLDKSKYEDYLEIQRLWLKNEVERYKKAKVHDCAIMDFGIEEIIFHTLYYPITIGMDWDVEGGLKEELDIARSYMPDRILFLDASNDVLRQRKASDPTRTRSSFDNYLSKFMPLKREWFSSLDNVDYINVNDMSKEEVAIKVKEWVDSCIGK